MQEQTERNNNIVKDKKDGMTYRQLEQKYGLSPNTITRIVYRQRERDEKKRLLLNQK